MKIRIAGLANDSIVDGPGLRLAIFTQGCPHHCPGCHNPQSHDFNGGELRDTDEIMEIVRENVLLDGITLSGGEPFAQPEACLELAKEAHALGLNVWCYSGYTFEALMNGEESWKRLLENVDVLVDGPFLIEQRTFDAHFRGSLNQRVLDVPQSLSSGELVFSKYQ